MWEFSSLPQTLVHAFPSDISKAFVVGEMLFTLILPISQAIERRKCPSRTL